jgi:hypothetical protein
VTSPLVLRNVGLDIHKLVRFQKIDRKSLVDKCRTLAHCTRGRRKAVEGIYLLHSRIFNELRKEERSEPASGSLGYVPFCSVLSADSAGLGSPSEYFAIMALIAALYCCFESRFCDAPLSSTRLAICDARSSIVGFSNMIFCEMRETALRVLESGDVRKASASLLPNYVTLKLRNVLKPKRMHQS